MTASTYSLWRKRLAPLALVVAIAALAHETCSSNERREVTLQFDLGPDAARVRRFAVDAFAEGAAVAQLQRTSVAGATLSPPQMKAVFPSSEVELRIELDVVPLAPEDAAPDASPAPAAEVTRRVVTRRIHVKGGTTLTVALAADLAR